MVPFWNWFSLTYVASKITPLKQFLFGAFELNQSFLPQNRQIFTKNLTMRLSTQTQHPIKKWAKINPKKHTIKELHRVHTHMYTSTRTQTHTHTFKYYLKTPTHEPAKMQDTAAEVGWPRKRKRAEDWGQKLCM